LKKAINFKGNTISYKLSKEKVEFFWGTPEENLPFYVGNKNEANEITLTRKFKELIESKYEVSLLNICEDFDFIENKRILFENEQYNLGTIRKNQDGDTIIVIYDNRISKENNFQKIEEMYKQNILTEEQKEYIFESLECI
jgi:transcription elongation factor